VNDVRYVPDINAFFRWNGSSWEQVSSYGSAISSWYIYYPTFSSGFGTVTTSEVYYKREGEDLIFRGKVLTGTVVTSSIATFTLPAGLTTDAAQFGTAKLQYCGRWVRDASSGTSVKGGNLGAIANSNLIQFSIDSWDVGVSPTALTTLVGAMFASGEVLEFEGRVKIAQWTNNSYFIKDYSECAYNSQGTINTSDSSSFGYGGGGTPILANTTPTYYDVYFPNAQPSDDFKLEFRSKIDGAWHDYRSFGVESLYLGDFSASHVYGSEGGSCYIRGVCMTRLAANKVRVRFPRVVITPGSSWDGGTFSDRTWASIIGASDGVDRWRVRRLTNCNLTEIPSLVRAEYSNAAAVSNSIINFQNKIEDTHNAVTTGSGWNFKAPISGIYLITGTAVMTTCNKNLQLYKNGVLYRYLCDALVNGNFFYSFSSSIRLNAGEYISIFTGDTVIAYATDHIEITWIGK
ncbi:MAG TPA: hypothetical protein PKK33_11120, partial [Candidatus Cloacimonadota bacterium]|nr:hypothetical protein [Candidatus Cloacimonadota bacterium]